MCPHEFDMALCFITTKKAAFSFSLVGHPSRNPLLLTSMNSAFYIIFLYGSLVIFTHSSFPLLRSTVKAGTPVKDN